MADGGSISIDWAKAQGQSVDNKLCVVIPGLGGHSQSGYVKSLVKTLTKDGFDVTVVHHRGVGNTEYTSAHFADLTSNEEFFTALNHIRASTDKRMVGIGMSMGANMIMRVAADMPDFPLEAIVSVNNPFDLWLSINLMRGKVFEKHLAKNLRDRVVARLP
jgi:uncharacterized protein